MDCTIRGRGGRVSVCCIWPGISAITLQALQAVQIATELRDALGACTELNSVYRQLVKMALADLQLIEQQIGRLDQEIASLLCAHQDAVQRLAEVPGLGVDSAQQIIAEVGAQAATFPSAKNLVSWVGACPGDEESAGVNRSKRVVGRSMPGRRRERRREPQQTRAEGQPSDAPHSLSSCECCRQTQREHLFVLRLGHNKTIGAIAHRLCQLIWIILHNGVRYEERGPSVSEKSKRLRTTRMIRILRNLGYPSRTFGKSGMRNPIFDPVVIRSPILPSFGVLKMLESLTAKLL
ncbi:MAG: hypothetical protein DMG70_01510 [Acidobacteria bacterium]|nr:MAG: hypothetical protein DMG70_01510 [Acidobacteriota bacterium]